MIDVGKLNLPTAGPVAEALEQFSVHNVMLGAFEILRDAALSRRSQGGQTARLAV